MFFSSLRTVLRTGLKSPVDNLYSTSIFISREVKHRRLKKKKLFLYKKNHNVTEAHFREFGKYMKLQILITSI